MSAPSTDGRDDALGLRFDTFHEQTRWLAERGLDEVTVARLGIEIRGAAHLKRMRFALLEHMARAVLWRVRDATSHDTGKVWARVWWRSERRHNAPWCAPQGQLGAVHYSAGSRWSQLQPGSRVEIYADPLSADVAAVGGAFAVSVLGVWGWRGPGGMLSDFDGLPWRELSLVPVVRFDVEPGSMGWSSVTQLAAMFHVKHGVRLCVPDGADLVVVADELTDHLNAMAGEVAVVKSLNKFINIETGGLMTRGEFEQVAYATRRVRDAEGSMVSVAREYTVWPGRTEVEEVVYRPGGPRLEPGRFYNTWRPSTLVPTEGDVGLFLSWLEVVLPDAREREYFLDWWSWLLQNPGGKLTTCMMMIGEPGIGKGWFTYCIERMLGPQNVAMVLLPTLDGRFNAELGKASLLVVEESDELGAGGQRIYNKLKDMVTSTTLRVERKGIDATFTDNVLNVFLTGNQLGVFRLDRNDRRMVVFGCAGASIANDKAFWGERWGWVRGGGLGAMYGFFLSRDVGGFNPHGSAPMTAAKEAMHRMYETPEERFCRALRADPVSVMGECTGAVLSAREAVWLMGGCVGNLSDVVRSDATRMGKALSREGFAVTNSGASVRCPLTGQVSRYFYIGRDGRVPGTSGEVRGLILGRSGWPDR